MSNAKDLPRRDFIKTASAAGFGIAMLAGAAFVIWKF